MARMALTPNYDEHRPAVLRTLARRCRWLDPSEREALFHDAYMVVLEKQRRDELEPMSPEQVRAYLIQTALYKALDEGKRAGRRRSVPLDGESLAQPAPDRAPDELAAASFESAQVREIVAELPARRQTIIKLRFFFDRTPSEIQRFMNITERTYRKELERGLRQIAEGYALVRDGRFCESRRSVILAYVSGIAGPNRAIDARRHLASCPACSRWATHLRERAEGIAALIPVGPFLTPRHERFGVGERWLAMSGERWLAARGALGRTLQTMRAHFGSWTGGADMAAAQYAATARPGAIAAALASCLAIGGGATYCVTAGVFHDQPQSHNARAERRDHGAASHAGRSNRAPQAPKRPIVVAPPHRTSRPAPRRTTHKSTTPLPHTIAHSVATAPPHDEFGFERRPAKAAVAASSARSSPPPAPPGEFDP
jgi:RNA polymerase sigma factor (sigma-70 family)